MSHGGFGGGGGHGGFGHGGGGGGGYGHGGAVSHHHSSHDSIFHTHESHVAHDGSMLGHGLGIGQHVGNVLGHILHSLGLGHLHHSHHMHEAHEPDQSPTWNQSMQAEKGWKKLFRRVDARPFAFVFLTSVITFGWLAVIYVVHRNESGSVHAFGHTEQVGQTACGPYGAPAPRADQQSGMPQQPFRAPVLQAPALSSFGVPYGYATAYGAASPAAPYAVPQPAAQGLPVQQMSSPLPLQQQMSGALPPRLATAPMYSQGQAKLLSGALARYVPEAGGRQRLFVSR